MDVIDRGPQILTSGESIVSFFEFIVDLLWGASEIFIAREKDRKQEREDLHDYMKREYGEKDDRSEGDPATRDRIDR
jgi:hypothetical protein